MAKDDILYAVDGAVATVTINRPTRRNSMTSSMLPEMNAILRRAADDPKVGVLILTGNGSDFCPGADLAVTAVGDTTARAALTPEVFLVPVLLHGVAALPIAAV